MPVDGLPGGDFDGCVEAMRGNLQDPAGFCAWKIHELTGKWPAAENKQVHSIEASLAPKDAEGRTWEVTIIGPDAPGDLVVIRGREWIKSKNGRLYAVDALERSVSAWEGVKVYDNHLTDAEFEEKAGMRSFLSEGAGILTDASFDSNERALTAILQVVDDTAARKLKNAHDQKVLQYIGLSIDVLTEEGPTLQHEGKRWPTVVGLEKVFSVDIVPDPAAGGKFNRLIAAKKVQEAIMPGFTEEQLGEVKALIAEALAVNGTQREQADEPETEAAMEEVADAVLDAAQEVPADATPAAAAQDMADAAQDAADMIEEETTEADDDEENRESQALETRLHQMECALLLRDELAAAKLDAPNRLIVEAAFKGQIFKKVDLMKVIKRAKEAQAAQDKTGQPVGVGAGRGVSMASVMSPSDKAEMGLLRLMIGHRRYRAFEQISDDRVTERHTEAFKSWQRAGRPDYKSRTLPNWTIDFLGDDPVLRPNRAFETVTTSNFSSVVKNTVNLIIAADYSVKEEWWGPIVTEEEVDTIDDATLARIFGLSTLANIAEGGPYTKLKWEDEEETASYQKKGNYIGITIETFMKTKSLAVLQSIPTRLSNSWFNTLSAHVSGVFTVNTAAGPALSDGGALFNNTAVSSATGHANLLATALSFTSYGVARNAMRKQTDQPLGAGRRLLIEPKFLLIPLDLETTADQIHDSEFVPSDGNNATNPHRDKFTILVVPDWTDVNNWALVADKVQFPAIYLIFPTGGRTPQLFTADSETSGAMFTNDTIRYKIRMSVFRFDSTYDVAAVADWRPLHKNNV